jgi:hypothetical protein
VRYNIKSGADVIKTCATGGVLSLTDDVDTPQLTQAELDALVDEAHALRRKTAAHAHGATGAKRAIRAGIDSIEHGTFMDDEALDMMKARGTFYNPTLMAIEGVKQNLTDGYLPPAGGAERPGGHGGAGRDGAQGHRPRNTHRSGDGRGGVPARKERRRIRPAGEPGDEAGRCAESRHVGGRRRARG